MICVAPHCDNLDAATEFEIYPPEPAAEILCFAHYRELVRKRTEAHETAVLARKRVEILSLPKMTCYGNGGTCPNEGAPYPGGPHCPEHAPNAFVPKSHPSPDASPAVKADVEQPGEPLLAATPCPADRMPGSVRSAVKYAQANGWDHDASIAIGPEPDDRSPTASAGPIHSVTFWASKDDVILSSRHEGTDAEHLGFKIAWHQTDNGLPIRIGWRELIQALQGTDPIEVENKRMREAVLDVMDVGGTVIEINATG